jgi:hypothetical protein
MRDAPTEYFLSACHMVCGAERRVSTVRLATLVDAASDAIGDALPFYRVADACREAGRFDLWLQGVTLAFEKRHETAASIYYRGRAKLTLDDWSGWADYEARLFHPRWGCSRPANIDWTHPRWSGSDRLGGQRLLVRRQGGFGDEILMLRFMRPLARQAGQVIVEVAPALVTFVKHNFGDAVTIIEQSDGRSVTGIDWHVWSLSLPFAVGCLPAFVPLAAPAPIARPCRSRRIRIGLNWATGVGPGHYRDRCVPLETLAPLFAIPDIDWCSIQVGENANDADTYPQLRRPDPPLATFADTANLIASVDYVVAVDTAVCHLSGSLGIPTALLLRYAADWKWGLSNTTPWYPSMQLIRQPSPGDWAGVVDELGRLVREQCGIDS